MAISMSGSTTWKAMLNISAPITSVDAALTVVESIPPRAMPARIDILDMGATRYSCRFPISFSQ